MHEAKVAPNCNRLFPGSGLIARHNLVICVRINTTKRKASVMVKVAAYHTSVPEYGGERNVYHDQSECPAGKRIKSEHRTPGTAGRPKCKDCQNI